MTPKKLLERKARIAKLNQALAKLYPDAEIELNFKNAWELVVAVQLSAQSTDKNVNNITEKLFKKYKNNSIWLSACGSSVLAMFARFDIDVEHVFEPSRPLHGRLFPRLYLQILPFM